MRVVAKILGHGQGGVADAEARARRFVHLAEDQHALIEDSRSFDLAVQFFAFPAAFADPAEYADAAMMADHVMDQLRDENRLADSGSSEQAALSTAFERRQHIDCLDSGDENFGSGRAAHQRNRRGVN